MIKLALFDIDETLWITKTKTIPESTKKALEILKNKGIFIAIASGRPYEAIEEKIIELGFDYYITNNGTSINDKDGKVIYLNQLTKKSKDQIIKYAKKNNEALLYKYIDGLDHVCYPEQFRVFYDSYGIPEKEEFYTYNNKNALPLSGTLRIKNQSFKDVSKRFPEIDFISTNVGDFYDFNNKGINKASAILKLCEILNTSKDNCMAFGDNYNDFEMLETVKYSIAMGNGVSALKNIAYYVTDRIENDGIYKAVNKLLEMENE